MSYLCDLYTSYICDLNTSYFVVSIHHIFVISIHHTVVISIHHTFVISILSKGVGEGGAAGACAPALSKVGGSSGFVPPHFWTDQVF